ncbi:MAG TPA: DMT family transporter [Pyrinomonadaceae bacterium]|nr:DMT family transporter [Pyrinomonadaceae bacterium]
MKTILYTSFALVAFAFNSILCRLALQTNEIDATSFTLIRLISGAVTLVVIYLIFNKPKDDTKRGSWLSAFFLFAYAVCFSFAYINLTTGTGALVLFGSVQATMIFTAILKGERPQITEWLGLIIALGGLIYLVFPGLNSPPFLSSVLMAIAGIAWAFYTLRGRTSANPLADTTGNFVRAVPMIILIALPFLAQIHFSQKGIALAAASGAIASGIGYSIWYAALAFHTATRAAILQLSVPALAGVGGVIFLAETISLRLITATILILGGIALAILRRGYGKNKV